MEIPKSYSVKYVLSSENMTIEKNEGRKTIIYRGVITTHFEKFIFLLGIIIASILDILFFRTIYFRHLIFGGLIMYSIMFILGIYIIINEKNFFGVCDNCNKWICIGNDVYSMIGPKKGLSFQFCNIDCIMKCSEKFPFINHIELVHKKITLDDTISCKRIFKILIFIILNPWSITYNSCDLFKYISDLKKKKKEKKISIYEQFILFTITYLDIS